MSDSDSASDSDISQGWTMVGPDGAVDSSDPDSDIVILKDEAEESTGDQATKEPESDELGNQHSDDLDMQSMESTCQPTLLNLEQRIDRSVEPGQDEADSSSREPDDGAKSLSMEPACKAEIPGCIEPEGLIADCKLGNGTRKHGDECDTGITEEEKIENIGLLTMDAGTDAGFACGDSLAVATEGSEPSVEWISSLEVKEGKMDTEPVAEVSYSMKPALVSTSFNLPLHDFTVSSAAKQKSQTEEGSVPLGFSIQRDDNGSDADASNDETDNDDDSDDDDESVVRKFHEATLNQRPGDRNENQQNDEEDEILPPDVDDRCESDISGVADDSDSDLSSVAGIDNLQLHVGEVVRTYRHQPNPTFNSRLTLIAATTVLLVLGIGIGHYIGTTRGSSFHQQQVLRLKTLQDEYFVCLRDTEKLELKLAKAMDSNANEKIAAVMAIWRKKYEELVLERAELEYKLILAQEEGVKMKVPEQEYKQDNMEEQRALQPGLEEHRQQSEEEQEPREEKRRHEPEIDDPRTLKAAEHRHITEKDLTIEEEPRNSSVEDSSASLQSEGVRCCHQVIELTADLNKRNLEVDRLRNDANQLVVENSELKAAILSQRYSEHPGNTGIGATEGEDKGFNKQRGGESFEDGSYAVRGPAQQEFRFPELVAHQQVQNTTQGQDHLELEIPAGADSQQNIREVMPQSIIVSVLRFFTSSGGKTPEPGSPDNRSLGTLVNCFTTLENVSLDHSFSDLLLQRTWSELEELVSQWDMVYRSCHEFIDSETSQNYSFVNKDSGISVPNDKSQQVNQLREMVKKLDVAVHGTVKSMQKRSMEPKSPQARLKAKTAVENWSRRMLSDWRKFDESMFRVQGREVFSDSKKRKTERSENFGEAGKQRGTLDQRSVGEKSKQTFEGNRDHKQTESSSSHQKYEEFWKRNHFDPDDFFLQEGFFEDNQREWHKHQKRLRKISGRIQRLTEEILLSMDDDDVEDIYEDVEDFIEDMEDREIPEQLRTWLTCQARWWRSRVQRKHRNEDLMKGCGQQLVHWQLRVLCKEGGKRGARNRKHSKLCKAVVSSQGRGMEKDKRLEQKHMMKRVGFGSTKVSSCAGGSARKSLQYKAQNVNPRAKVSYGERFGSAVDYKVEKNSGDAAFTCKNLTFADYGAYDDDLFPTLFPWRLHCSHTASNKYDENLAEGHHCVN